MGLGGIMFWSYDLDDFFGSFCRQGKYPLLSALALADSNSNESTSNSKPTGSSPEPETTTERETTTRVVQATTQTPKPPFKLYVVDNGGKYMFLCNILLLFSLSISFVFNMI
jgi:chitinase